MSLSQRGQGALNKPLRADLELFLAAMEDRYQPEKNPAGKLTLCVAENLLNWSEMEAKLRGIAAGAIPEWVPSYTSLLGAPALREAAAGFLGHFLAGAALDPENFAAAAGAGAVIEMTALLLGDPADVVVIPGPAYMAYTPDLGNKAGLQRYDLHLPAPPTNYAAAATPTSTPKTCYELTTADLDRAHADLGDRFRILLLTQPNNPTGQIFTEAQLNDFADWCADRKIHLVVNEIYAFSLLDQQHPDLREDYGEDTTFTSALRLLEQKKSPYFHWWYAISKDFGLSGLRLGLCYTHNKDLLKAWGNFGVPSMASNHTQWMLAEIFADRAWVERFVATNKQRLTASYALVVRTLRQHGISYAPAAGSLFVWFNLGRLLTADTEKAEVELWQKIYDETGILLTSPLGQGSAERGWFRMVYSCVSYMELEVAMERLGGFLGKD